MKKWRAIVFALVGIMSGSSVAAQSTPPPEDDIWSIPPTEGPSTPARIPLLLDAEGSLGYSVDELFYDDTSVRNATPSLRLALAMEVEATSWLWLNLLLDTGYMNVVDGALVNFDQDADSGVVEASQEALSGNYARTLSVALGQGGIHLQAGRLANSIGEGLVYENYGLGGILAFDLERLQQLPLQIEVSVQAPGDRWSQYSSSSTLSALRLEYDYSYYESLRLFTAYYRERNNQQTYKGLSGPILEPVYEQILEENDTICSKRPESRDCVLSHTRLSIAEDQEKILTQGDLWYAGLGGNIILFDQINLRANGVLLLGSGESSVDLPQNFQQATSPVVFGARFSAWAAQVDAAMLLSPAWEIAWETFGLSGNTQSAKPNTTTDYTGFVGIAPYWAWSSIFFENGLDRNQYETRIITAGDSGQGVFGSGPRLVYSAPTVTVETKLLALSALSSNASSEGSFYGVESNTQVSWDLSPQCWISGEAHFFFPGNFFDDTFAYRMQGFLNGRFND
jgi:hypothetical protein